MCFESWICLNQSNHSDRGPSHVWTSSVSCVSGVTADRWAVQRARWWMEQCGQQRHGWAQSGPGAVLAHCDHRGVRWLWSGLSGHTHTHTQYYTSRLRECVFVFIYHRPNLYCMSFWPSAGHEVNVASLYLGCVYFKMHPNNTAHNLLTDSYFSIIAIVYY